MNILSSIDPKFDKILMKFGDIYRGIITNNNDKDIAEFIIRSEGLFRSWKSFFNPAYLSNIKRSPQLKNYFCEMLEKYLPESGNGSWNGMDMQTGNLCNQYNNVLDAFIDILNFNKFIFPDYDDVKSLLHKYVDRVSGHISGMGILLTTSILFIHDENHFMVLDDPVKKYFQINNDNDAIDNYDSIIAYSQNLSAKYKLSMWMVNKAYAVYIHGGQIKISNSKYIKI
ncbi:hypothetical protein [Picrophilus oshimae]|uniref:Hypothetical membrane associated protein n=1 Tax=Picrophilus torridus (strain ATCC 700027 / DSM 9790 / JCM 10055 / NBRC 100828 / KAW 2/3) TaxID=1122961 RepID=Q6L341_PICTO|nr:hypothetical protein [Picrophilus oshimae]AAT42610.1 hypothetical membrane associated protein [Picrophilus oshimae DSM 9789]